MSSLRWLVPLSMYMSLPLGLFRWQKILQTGNGSLLGEVFPISKLLGMVNLHVYCGLCSVIPCLFLMMGYPRRHRIVGDNHASLWGRNRANREHLACLTRLPCGLATACAFRNASHLKTKLRHDLHPCHSSDERLHSRHFHCFLLQKFCDTLMTTKARRYSYLP